MQAPTSSSDTLMRSGPAGETMGRQTPLHGQELTWPKQMCGEEGRPSCGGIGAEGTGVRTGGPRWSLASGKPIWRL